MARGVVVKTEVFTERLYAGHGDVRQWVDLITDRFTRETKKYVASSAYRSGRLLRGIRHTTRGNPAAHTVTGSWYSSAPHTMYVLRGTTGPIMSNRMWVNPGGAFTVQKFTNEFGEEFLAKKATKGYFMPIPDRATGKFNPKAGQGHFAARVDGQRANNFLERAWRGTARDHRAIRGKRVPRFIRNP